MTELNIDPTPLIPVFAEHFNYRAVRKVATTLENKTLVIGSCTENDCKIIEEHFKDGFDNLRLTWHYFNKEDFIAIGKAEELNEINFKHYFMPTKKITDFSSGKIITVYECHLHEANHHFSVVALINCILESLGKPKYVVIYTQNKN
jgi:hypothetical protein